MSCCCHIHHQAILVALSIVIVLHILGGQSHRKGAVHVGKGRQWDVCEATPTGRALMSRELSARTDLTVSEMLVSCKDGK